MIHAARGIATTLLVVFLALGPASALAQTPPPDPPDPIPSERLDDLIPWPVGDLPGGRGPLSHGLDAVSDPLVSVIVQFEGPALAAQAVERGQMTTFDQRSYTATLHSRQAEVVSRVQQTGGAVIGRFTKAYNGVQVQVPASELAELRKASGVKAIHPVRTYYPALDHSTEIIRANEVWALNGTGYDGDGMTIAVIDTGIDYTHAAFGGLGTAAAYDSNHPNIVEFNSFPTDKVIGGYDFAGTDYNASPDNPQQRIPNPDDDPLDEHVDGHGTHVASIAAGDTVNGFAFSGVAPSAKLYAVKIFGRAGATELLMNALEWCTDPNRDGIIDDSIDIINISLGSPFGSMIPDPEHPENMVMQTLTDLGVVIVAAAGNDWNIQYVAGSPASIDEVISVASTQGVGEFQDKIADTSSRGPRGFDSALKPEISAPGANIRAAYKGSGTRSRFLSGTSMAAPHVAGTAALVRQAHPEWTPEQIKAALINTAFNFGEELPRMGAGRVDALRAVTTETVAVGDPKLVSLSWGVIEFDEPLFSVPNSKLVTVHNFFPEDKTYTISCSWADCEADGAKINVPASVTVPANGGTAVFDVGMQLDASHIMLSASTSLAEYQGFIKLENQDPAYPDDKLVIPFYFIPNYYNTLTVSELTVDRTSATGIITHDGVGAAVPEVWPVYSIDPNEPHVLDHGDLRMVMMDYNPILDRIVFGFNFYSARPNPFPTYGKVDLLVDVDNDGLVDYVFFNNNQNGIGVLDVANPDRIDSPFNLIDYDFNSGTMFWSLTPVLYGMSPENSIIAFCVYSRDVAGNIDFDSSCHRVNYLQRPFTAQVMPGTLSEEEQTAMLELQADSVAGSVYNRPIGAAIVNSTGKAGEGEVTFLPFEFDFYEVYTPLILR